MSHIPEGSLSSNSHVNGSQNRRSSSTSGKSAASSVETTITKLLMSTKQLLQTLTQWSRGSVNEKMVSDAYVQLGNDFKVVSKVFNHCGVDVSDLGDVPMDLRRVLEAALREKPSDDNLNKYLPSIREIIVTLLDKLKVKQAMLKSIKQDNSMRKSQHQQRPSVVNSLSLSQLSSPKDQASTDMIKSPYKSKTAPNSREMGEPGMQRIPSENYLSPHPQVQQRTLSEDEALSQLKKSSNLQRRASKRFSAYHMAKLTNQSTTEAAAAAALASSLPPAVSNPLPSIPIVDPAEAARAKTEYIDDNSTANHMKQPNTANSNISKDSSYTLFLSMNGKTKRCVASTPLNINVIRLLFVEKFAYSPGGNSFPDMYIKDPEYSVFYELDDQGIADVRSGSTIELRENSSNTTFPDFSGIIDALKHEISKSQEDLTSHIRELGVKSQQAFLASTNQNSPSIQPILNPKGFDVMEIKRDIAKLRELQKQNNQRVRHTVADVFEKLANFKTLSLDSLNSSNKTYIERSQTHLGEVSDDLLSRVDDLQDLIETLRKDVAVRGARPSKKKLDSVHEELKSAQGDLETMREYIGTEKPRWKTVWEKELDKVCEEQQFLTLQEDLATDLGEDLGKALETFNLVNLCCAEQEKNPNKNKTNPILPIPKPGELRFAREQLLMDVQALHPDHDGRVEALEKAKKLWEKERNYKDNDAFEEELGTFVVNSSFRSSGGVEEVERLRRQKDEENLRANFAPTF